MKRIISLTSLIIPFMFFHGLKGQYLDKLDSIRYNQYYDSITVLFNEHNYEDILTYCDSMINLESEGKLYSPHPFLGLYYKSITLGYTLKFTEARRNIKLYISNRLNNNYFLSGVEVGNLFYFSCRSNIDSLPYNILLDSFESIINNPIEEFSFLENAMEPKYGDGIGLSQAHYFSQIITYLGNGPQKSSIRSKMDIIWNIWNKNLKDHIDTNPELHRMLLESRLQIEHYKSGYSSMVGNNNLLIKLYKQILVLDDIETRHKLPKFNRRKYEHELRQLENNLDEIEIADLDEIYYALQKI